MNRIEAHAVSSSFDKARRWFGRLDIQPQNQEVLGFNPGSDRSFLPLSFLNGRS